MDAPDPIAPSDAAVTAGDTEPDSVASSSTARADLKGTTGVIEAPTNVPQPSPPSSSSVDGRDLPLRELLDKWGPSVMSVESDMNTKLIHLDPTEAPRRQDAMRALRRDLDAPGRRALAETYKTLANAQFAKEGWRVALVGYLAGAWMLRDGDPPCPKLLANHLSELDAAGDALGPAYMTLEAESVALRASLLLNFAAAALKLHEWRLARTACEAVLVSQPRNTKALWRLAKAYEGDSNLTDALATAVKLFKLDPANAEYERLADRLWARKGRAGKMFNSFLERAQLEGDTLYTQREYERDVSEAMRKGFISCMGKPFEGEEHLIPKPPDLPEGIYEDKDEHGNVIYRNADGEETKVTEMEMWELHARHHYSHRKEPTEDEKALNRAMGGAYNKTVLWREQGVRQNLPPNVLASKDYVDQ